MWDCRDEIAVMHYRRPLIPPSILTVIALCLVAGCSVFRSAPKIDERVSLIAVLPIERAEPPGAAEAARPVVSEPPSAHPPDEGRPAPGGAGAASARDDAPRLAPGAERVVTAQIYEVLSSSSRWRFVPDLTTTQALSKLPVTGDLASRARALGKAVGADAVLFGTVSRYVERVGSEYGAKEPAAVGFSLQLISVSADKILWKGAFDQKQEPLSSNLFNWWQFWKGGPRWFSAQEFTRIAVEHLLDDLAKHLGY